MQMLNALTTVTLLQIRLALVWLIALEVDQRYHFMHLFPELSLAFSFFTPVFYFASSVGLFVPQSISTIKTLSAITKQSSEISTLHEKGICIESRQWNKLIFLRKKKFCANFCCWNCFLRIVNKNRNN